MNPEPILVVDDEEGLRYVMTRQLRSAGYTVEAAEDGQEAIEKLSEKQYAVVITDMKMPRVDGLGVIQKANEIAPNTELIVLTGHGSLENAVDAFKAGNVAEYLLKPLDDIGLLNAVVTRALEKRHLKLQNRQLTSELQCAYEELKKTSKQLIQSEKMSAIGQLAAGVAHELNNPLTAVLGFAQFIDEKVKEQAPREWNDEDTNRIMNALQNVVKGAHRCRDIVASLIRFSRSSHAELHSEIDINQVLMDAFVFTEHLLLRQGITLVKNLSQDLPKAIGSASRLQHVFTNLIINAQQASSEGGVVTVTTQYDPNSQTIAIMVEDSGPGIQPDHLPHIFEAFYTTRPESHAGLGLSIASQIVQEHHGEITVQSQPERGSRFIVSLPIAKALETDPPDALAA